MVNLFLVAMKFHSNFGIRQIRNDSAVAARYKWGTAMNPGEYVLQIVVSDLLAKEKHRIAMQWTDFEIVQ